MASVKKTNTILDIISHDIPTVVLGVGTAFGLDSTESSVLLKSVTTIITALLTLIPIIIHAYNNRGLFITNVKKEVSNPSALISDAERAVSGITQYLPKDVADKVSTVEKAVSGYEKDVEELKANYKGDVQSYAQEVAVELKKELAAKYDPLLKDVADLKDAKKAGSADMLSTLSNVLAQAQKQSQVVSTKSTAQADSAAVKAASEPVSQDVTTSDSTKAVG